MGSGMMRELASPTWRVMLLSDGSVTRHLQVCFLCRTLTGGAEGSLPSA